MRAGAWAPGAGARGPAAAGPDKVWCTQGGLTGLDLLSRSRGTPLSLYSTVALRRLQLCSDRSIDDRRKTADGADVDAPYLCMQMWVR